jgi:hypothetical protein
VQKVHVRKAKRRAKVDTKTAENLRATVEQQVKLIVRVAQLRKTMLEARQVAGAAEQDYAFAEEAGSRARELALWATLSGYHAKPVEDRWIVAEFEGKLEPDATLQEALLRADDWRLPQAMQEDGCREATPRGQSTDGQHTKARVTEGSHKEGMARANRAGQFWAGRSTEPSCPHVFKLRQTEKAQGNLPGPSVIECPVTTKRRRLRRLKSRTLHFEC